VVEAKLYIGRKMIKMIYCYEVGGIIFNTNFLLPSYFKIVEKTQECLYVEYQKEKVPSYIIESLGKWSKPPKDGQPYGINSASSGIILSMTNSYSYIEGDYIKIWPREGEAGNNFHYNVVDELMTVIALLSGRLTLHGAAFVYNDLATIILAPPGTGKSTLSAVIASRFGNLISDDQLIVHEQNGEFYVRGIASYIKLGTQANKILPKGIQGTKVRKGTSKKYYNVNDFSNWISDSTIIGSIYILELGEEFFIKGSIGNGWKKWRALADFVEGGRALPTSHWNMPSMLLSKLSSKCNVTQVVYSHTEDSMDRLINLVVGGECNVN
jgi:hypothetical protein